MTKAERAVLLRRHGSSDRRRRGARHAAADRVAPAACGTTRDSPSTGGSEGDVSEPRDLGSPGLRARERRRRGSPSGRGFATYRREICSATPWPRGRRSGSGWRASWPPASSSRTTIVLELLREKLADAAERHAVPTGGSSTGYPRTRRVRRRRSRRCCDKTGETIDAVIYIELDPEVVVNRLSNRRTCAACKAVYHLVNNPPAVEGKCDACGGKLVLREDDKPETIRKRLEVYKKETLPILSLYEKTAQGAPRGRLEADRRGDVGDRGADRRMIYLKSPTEIAIIKRNGAILKTVFRSGRRDDRGRGSRKKKSIARSRKSSSRTRGSRRSRDFTDTRPRRASR